jgi:polyisoprenyl-phosphate glycosyltransferase
VVLWVVTPVYLDVESFLELRLRVLAVLGEHVPQASEVRFVAIDDTAGRDAEVERLAALPDVRVLRPPFNLGHQRALVFGVRRLRDLLGDDDVVVTMDADGEDRPEDLPRLLGALLEAGPGTPRVALAWRTSRQESPLFRAGYVVFRTGFRALTGAVVRSGNFAAYRGRFAREVLRHPHFDQCYSATLLSLDLDVVCVPAPRGARYAGRSRMNYQRLFMHGLRMLMPFTDRIASRALLAFSATVALAVALAATVAGVRLLTDAAIPGWATTTIGLLVVLSFVALGNLLVLFFVFSHSRGVSLSHLEEDAGGGAGSAPAAPDRALV